MDIKLREADPKDAEAIGTVRVAAWRAAYQSFMPENFLANLDPTHNLAELKERLVCQSTDFALSVAEKCGEVVAFSIIGKPRFSTAPEALELWALNVLPECWRLGVGSSLIERAVNYAAHADFKSIELWCLEGNAPAQQAYEKLGFVKSGRAKSSSQLTGHTLHELHYLKSLE